MLVDIPLSRAYARCQRTGVLVARASGERRDGASTDIIVANDKGLLSRRVVDVGVHTISVSVTDSDSVKLSLGVESGSCLTLKFENGCLSLVATSLLSPNSFLFSFHETSLLVFSNTREYRRYTGVTPLTDERFFQSYLMDYDALLACTPYQGIFTLPLGQNLAITESECNLQSASIPFDGAIAQAPHFDDVADSILNCLRRCPEDAGIVLSGDLDSSLIALISNTDQKTKHYPLVHFVCGPGRAGIDALHARQVARDCGRELVIVDQESSSGAQLNTNVALQWPSKKSVYDARLNLAEQVTECSMFIDGYGGNSVFYEYPGMQTIFRGSAGSFQKRMNLLALCEERLYLSIYRTLSGLIHSRLVGKAAISEDFRQNVNAYGMSVSGKITRDTVREVSRVCANFHHPERDTLFWYSILTNAADEKRERLSACSRTYSPLRDWGVIASTLAVKAEGHIYPENRAFQRNLIRHISKSPVADRHGFVDNKEYALLLLDNNIEKVQSLLGNTFENMSILNNCLLKELVGRRFYDGHDILLDLYSAASFIQRDADEKIQGG